MAVFWFAPSLRLASSMKWRIEQYCKSRNLRFTFDKERDDRRVNYTFFVGAAIMQRSRA